MKNIKRHHALTKQVPDDYPKQTKKAIMNPLKEMTGLETFGTNEKRKLTESLPKPNQKVTGTK